MGSSVVVQVLLPAALALVMLGLGLSLTVDDFRRVGREPTVALTALFFQILVLPLACFGLVLLSGLPPVLAVGMMLLAASPGGTAANLFSHLFRGDVALNISLTAINSVLAVVTLPIVVNLAFLYFGAPGEDVGLQFGKVLQVFAIVLVPVFAGMLLRRRAPVVVQRLDLPVRVLSVVVLAAVVLAAIVSEWQLLSTYFTEVALVATAFCLISLAVGYSAPRGLGIGRRQSIACSMEIGMHNATLAIAVAVGVIGSEELAVPAAVYGVLMFPLAAAFGWAVTRTHTQRDEVDRLAGV